MGPPLIPGCPTFIALEKCWCQRQNFSAIKVGSNN